MAEKPHRMVDEVVKGLVSGAENVGRAAVNGLKSGLTSFTEALDKPTQATIKKEGPHHIVAALVTGVVDASQNLVESGIIGTAKILGEGIQKALDQPAKQVGEGFRWPWSKSK